jgi:hypothetical protein
MREEAVFSPEVICKAMDFCLENKRQTSRYVYTVTGLAKDTALFLKTLHEEIDEVIDEQT